MQTWLITLIPWLRALLGLVFVLAAVTKLHHPAGFTAALAALGIERPVMHKGLKIGVPLVEMGLGIWLWTGWSPLFAAVAASMMLVLLTWILIDLRRTGYEGSCGCFIGDHSPVGAWQIVRNTVLLVLSLGVGVGAYAAPGTSAPAAPAWPQILLLATFSTGLLLGGYALLLRRGRISASVAPPMELTDLAGNPIIVGRPEADHQVVVFARGRCSGCLRDRDLLNGLPDSGSTNVAGSAELETVIVCGGDPETAKEFAAEVRPPVRVVSDPRWRTAVAWQVSKTPYSVLVDHHGSVKARGELGPILARWTSLPGSAAPKPRRRSSRQRYKEFVRTYRQQRKSERRRAKRAKGTESVSPPRNSKYLRRYARWILPHWRTIALVLALSVVAEGLKMAEPLMMRFIVDHVLLSTVKDASARLWLLNVTGAAFIAVVLLGKLINMLKDDRQRWMDLSVKVSLRRSLIERLLQLPLSRLAEMKIGGILSRLTGDVDVTSSILQRAIVFPAVSILRFLIAGGILFALNWQLALTVLAALPGLIMTSFAMANRVRPIYRSIRQDAAAIDGRAAEAFSGIRIVRAFHRETREILDYMKGQHTMLRKEMFAHRRELVLWLLWGLLLGGTNVVIVWYGGYLHLEGRASVGDIMAFQWYTLLLLNPVLNIVHSFSQLQQSQAAAERVFEALEMERDKPDRPDALEAPSTVREIDFDHVDFAYREDRTVIRDFNVKVPGGVMVALVGRSGAGKTTLTDLVGRFHDPTRGRITLNGTDIRDFRIRSYRSLFAIVQQHVFLFDGSVRENIAYARPDARDVEVKEAARRANAHDFIEQLPEGYDTHVGERGVKLSGGQQQRLAIARAFLKAPAILIMDEATSNLDTESEQLIDVSMEELMAFRTTFVIAHRLSTIQRADLILVIDNGRIVEQGGHEELMRKQGIYHDMVVRQMISSRE